MQQLPLALDGVVIVRRIPNRADGGTSFAVEVPFNFSWETVAVLHLAKVPTAAELTELGRLVEIATRP
jgi:hypothetical protein